MYESGPTRRQFLQAGLAALAAPILQMAPDGGAGLSGSEGEVRPNLVYIFADQLRACSVGSYRNPEISTPHIDQLVAEGARFSNAVSTSPLCTPHRACLMTGRYPTVTGVKANYDVLPQEELGIAEVLGWLGYRSQFIGKWHLAGRIGIPYIDPGWVPPEDRQGFQHWVAFNCGHQYYGGKYYLDADPTMRQIPPGIYEPDFQAEQAIRFIHAHRDERFCVFLALGPPHPSAFPQQYLPPGGDYQFPYEPENLTLRPNVDHPNPDFCRQRYADYYGVVSNLDWNVGRIMGALDALGLADNTVLALSSDHGDVLGSHYGELGQVLGKGVIYSESLDVPFVLRYPSRVSPTTVDEPFTSVDIMPTLLGLCGQPVVPGVMGRNFAPRLTRGLPPVQPPWGPVPSTESALVGMFKGQWVGVRTCEFTLECDGQTLLPAKLFHNTRDPYQLTNRAEDPGYAPIVASLQDQLFAWLDYVLYEVP